MRRSLIDACGGLNEKYHFCFDKDMLLRYLYFYPNVAYTDKTLVNFRFHDDSKTVAFRKKFADETKEIIRCVLNDPKLPDLHKGASWRIRQGDWLQFLRTVVADQQRTKWERILQIIYSSKQQPLDAGGFRMTVGAIRRIFKGETIPE
jgi:hypothetical protein